MALASARAYRRSPLIEMLSKARDPGYIDLSLFMDALPIPQKILVGAKTREITLEAKQVSHSFYKEMPDTQVWGWNGQVPGPTIEVFAGKPLVVHWKNSLPKEPLLPNEDHPMPGMAFDPNLPKVRTVTHLHGAKVVDSISSGGSRFLNNDGWPDAWIVPGETQTAYYPNAQSSRTLWYHDHAMGQTTRNNVAGLYGMYWIRDQRERSLNLPAGKFEIPLIFGTPDFNDDGSLYYPSKMSAEVYGGTITVNGKLCPYLEVEPRKYRFRMLNAASARTFAFKIIETADGTDGPAITQIGSDGGLLESPVILNEPGKPEKNRLIINPSERADVIVDFSKREGRTLLLHNNFTSVAGEGDLYIPNIMIFKVAPKVSSTDHSEIPSKLGSVPRIPESSASGVRRITLSQVLTPNLPPVMMINEKVWEDPLEETPKADSTEIWEIVNTLPDSHPFHMHLVNFQLLDRREFDVDQFLKDKSLVYTAESIAARGAEAGWKDTINVPPGSVTRIIVRFGKNTGRYAYHCHILEHEDMGMMRPFQIVK